MALKEQTFVYSNRVRTIKNDEKRLGYYSDSENEVNEQKKFIYTNNNNAKRLGYFNDNEHISVFNNIQTTDSFSMNKHPYSNPNFDKIESKTVQSCIDQKDNDSCPETTDSTEIEKHLKISKMLSICIIISRVLIFTCLIAWSVHQINHSIHAAIRQYYTPREQVEFQQYGISVTCKQFFWSTYSFNDGGFNYCVKPLIKFDESIASHCNNVKQQINMTHSTETWRFLAEYTHQKDTYGRWLQSDPDAVYAGCQLFCAIASNSTCHVSPSDTTTHLLPISNFIIPHYSTIGQIPYYPIQFTAHKFAEATTSTSTLSDKQCYYISSLDGYFSNDPFCRVDEFCTKECTQDCLDTNYERFAMIAWKFNCSIDPWNDYFKGPSNEEVKSNPDLFYSACEECPKPIFVSFISYVNEALIGLVLLIYSRSKKSNNSVGVTSYRQLLFRELQIYWDFGAISRACIAAFVNVYAISRAVQFGGWMGYQCLNHIAFNSSATRICSIQIVIFIYDRWSQQEDTKTSFRKMLMILKLIPMILIFIFYFSVMLCGMITHIIVFEFGYIWVVTIIIGIVIIPSALILGLLRCLNIENAKIAECIALFTAIIGLGAVFIYGIDVTIALYLGFTYMNSLAVPLDRSFWHWLQCSSYYTAFNKITHVLVDIL
eukprot:442827_1